MELQNVHFSYTKGYPILRGISLKIRAGESVAFVGPSGGGKSSILKLLTRQYDVSAGRIMVDGFDVRDLNVQSLREAIAVVPQDTIMLSGTVSMWGGGVLGGVGAWQAACIRWFPSFLAGGWRGGQTMWEFALAERGGRETG